MHNHPQNARRHLTGRLVNRHDAPRMQAGIFFIGGQNFELRMHHRDCAVVGVELNLAKQRHAQADFQHIFKVRPVKPLANEPDGRLVAECGFEHPNLRFAELGRLRGAHLDDHRRHFADRQLADGLHIAAVFVAEWRVGEQILNGGKALRFKHLGAHRANALDVHQWGGEIQSSSPRWGLVMLPSPIVCYSLSFDDGPCSPLLRLPFWLFRSAHIAGLRTSDKCGRTRRIMIPGSC